ncbi:unnamed protein product [Tilletia caries]|nr:unnamed protein product [Tilletia caries]
MDPDTAYVDGIAPAKLMEVDQVEEVLGSGKNPYKLKRHSDHYSCTCPAWRFQSSVSITARTCKHLKALLGEKYENERVVAAGGAAPSPSSSPKKRAASASSSASPTKKAKNSVSLMLAETFAIDGNVDPTGWWLSEKLDGVRAYWDGSSIWSRASVLYDAPQDFKDKLPTDMSLDGELWMERDAFDGTSSIIRSGTSGWKKWDRIIYMVFDVVGDSNPFEQRLEALKQRFGEPLTPTEVLAQKGVPGGRIVVLKHEKCTSRDHLLEELTKVEAVGGEGLMLRKAGSQYDHRRSRSLLKVGTGFTDSHRNNPPSVGSIITYKFQELSQDGIPRFPVFKGIAADKTKPKDAVVRSTQLRADKAAAAAALTAATEASAEASSSGTQKKAPAKGQKKK